MSSFLITRRLSLTLGAAFFCTAFLLGVVQSWRQQGTLPPVADDALAQGRQMLEHGDVTRALAQLRMQARIEPRRPDGWLRLGQALAATGDSAGAIEAFEQSLGLVPVSTLAHIQLATLYLQAGRTEDARAQARLAHEDGAELPAALLQFVDREPETHQ